MSIANSEQKKRSYLLKPTKLMSLRMKKNASQVEVSKAVGLSRIHYGNVEKGLHTAKTELAEEIAKYFKSPIATIFKKVDDVHYLVKK